jgi:signal transduction histidine kinase
MEMNTRQLIHDLNNVIGATIGYGSIAMEQLADYDPVKHYIEGMTTSALQAAELCKHYLLNYKKGEQMERCTINAIVTQTAAILESIKPATVNIVMDLTVDELIGSIKPLRLQQALLNLGFNAIQAMPQGGTLTYSSQLQRDDQGGRALIRVSDTGSGIAEAIRERIFTLGFTTKPEGNGIGLHIIKKVVEEHHGTLALVSTKMGGGSCFEITLPLLKV